LLRSHLLWLFLSGHFSVFLDVKKPIAAALIVLGIALFLIPLFRSGKPIVIPQADKKVTSGWKEYKNSQYRFSFKYPEGLLSNFKVDSTGPIDITLKQLESNKKSEKITDPNSYNVFFEANGWRFKGSIDEFINENLQIKNYKRQKIKVGNFEGLRISNLEEKADAYYYYNLFKYGNYVYNFAIFADNADEIYGNKKLLDDILSTVTFE